MSQNHREEKALRGYFPSPVPHFRCPETCGTVLGPLPLTHPEPSRALPSSLPSGSNRNLPKETQVVKMAGKVSPHGCFSLPCGMTFSGRLAETLLAVSVTLRSRRGYYRAHCTHWLSHCVRADRRPEHRLTRALTVPASLPGAWFQSLTRTVGFTILLRPFRPTPTRPQQAPTASL